MKKKWTVILAGVLFLAGLGIFLYPTLSNWWTVSRQGKLIDSQRATLERMTEEDFGEEWAKAERYNDRIIENNIYTDVFEAQGDSSGSAAGDTEYLQVLNIDNNGIMGYLSIPKIDVKMPIYHGTAEGVLQTGAGHLSGTKLPIGGESTHSVLAAHRGLPSARLFTDIDQLAEGDRFYIYILDRTLAYEVDQILPMVDKDDRESIDEALAIVEGEDHVTLFTCTPYGVNTHRLLVRGRRMADEKAQEMTETEPVGNGGGIFWAVGVAAAAAAVLILRRFYGLHGRLKQEGKR